MGRTYLVTGGAGFIGSNFVLTLLSQRPDAKVINLDKLTYAGNLRNLERVMEDPRHVFIKGDICDRELLDGIFRDHDPDFVVNFAAESHVDRSISDPSVFVRTNVLGTGCLLDTSKAAWQQGDSWREGKKYLQVSTDEVYGSLGAEGFFTEETPLDPHSPYSASKAAADLLVKAYHDTYGMPVNITRCSNNYGPYQFPEKLIPLIINNCRNLRELPVYGDGMQIRDWLYVEDHCRAILMVLDRGVPGQVYNIGGHNERTNIFIVKAIISHLRELGFEEVSEGLIRHVADRKGHDRRYGIDPAKIGRELGWQPETMFEQGIIKTIDWYLSNDAWLDEVVSGDYQSYYQRQYGGRG